MPRVIAVVNQKGGVGKTTTTVNLAAALAQAGKRVLLVDLDPQGNATMGSGIDKRTLARTVYHVLLGLGELGNIRQRSEKGGYDLVPANRDLAGAEVELVDLEARETRLKAALERVAADYDFILLDCPPSLSLLLRRRSKLTGPAPSRPPLDARGATCEVGAANCLAGNACIPRPIAVRTSLTGCSDPELASPLSHAGVAGAIGRGLDGLQSAVGVSRLRSDRAL